MTVEELKALLVGQTVVDAWITPDTVTLEPGRQIMCLNVVRLTFSKGTVLEIARDADEDADSERYVYHVLNIQRGEP
jgi:hypothetical protein